MPQYNVEIRTSRGVAMTEIRFFIRKSAELPVTSATAARTKTDNDSVKPMMVRNWKYHPCESAKGVSHSKRNWKVLARDTAPSRWTRREKEGEGEARHWRRCCAIADEH